MELMFLGTGSAFSLENYQSNMLLINERNEKLLIDCGTDIRFALAKYNLSYRDIANVYISHLHGDHAGGLEWLALTTRFDPTDAIKPNLFICNLIVKDLWNKKLAGGLSTLPGEIAELDSYFKVHAIPANESFFWDHHEFKLIQTVHVMNGFSLMNSYGLLFTINDQTIFITTDTQFCYPQLKNFYERADIIFHDCELLSQPSGVHAHYQELITLSPEIKAKMWLYHYQDGPLPPALEDGFKGFVKQGQRFTF